MKNFLFSFLLLSVLNASAQYHLSGTVSDAKSGEILAGATVRIVDTYLYTTTDAKGEFHFYKLNGATYSVIISYIGFQSHTEKVTLLADTALTIKLSLSRLTTDEAVVIATKVNGTSAMAFSNLDKNEIKKQNTGVDIPYMLQLQPSVVATSDAGTGVGYTGLRIRGTDASRINVTVNGIPLNDPESQQLYWVDLPDVASSLDNIQIQRGVGTSTNGAGAFGASIDLQTSKPKTEAFGEANIAAGSFNSWKRNFTAGTGLLNDHFSFEARMSKITSDGYVDRATADLESYFLSANYMGEKNSLRLNLISGKEKTYQAWNGVPESRINNDVQGMQDFIDRNYLDAEDAANLLNSGRTYNYFTYNNQTDNYKQDHYQLFFTHQFNPNWLLNTTLHYTKGKGYYEEYKKQQDIADYNLAYPVVGSDTIFTTDLVRQKWLDNDFYGAIVNAVYDDKSKIKFVAGGAVNQYYGRHYGNVIWAEYYGNNQTDFEYYRDAALKNDANVFAKLLFTFHPKWTAMADVQYRYVDYHFNGFDAALNQVPESDKMNFFNPKAGITFMPDAKQSAYASVSIGNHEPSRDDYVNSSTLSRPKPETLYDIEAGYNFHNNKFIAGFNFYYMYYKNQLVLTGQLNDVGEYTRTNTPKSYREGLEINAAYSFTKRINLKAWTTLSQNKINNFTEYLDDYDNGNQTSNIFTNTNIAFSPSVTAGGMLSIIPVKSLTVDLIAKHVGKQYLDNTENEARKLNPYTTCDIRLQYILSFKHLKEIGFNMVAVNIFNELYESNGYTYSYIYNQKTTTENFYYPQAGLNFMGQVTFRF